MLWPEDLTNISMDMTTTKSLLATLALSAMVFSAQGSITFSDANYTSVNGSLLNPYPGQEYLQEEIHLDGIGTTLTISQQYSVVMTLAKDQMVSGQVAFDMHLEPGSDRDGVPVDWLRPVDYAQVSVSGPTVSKVIKQTQAFSWLGWSFQAPIDGDYQFNFEVQIAAIEKRSAFGLFAPVMEQSVTPVPEPSTWVAGAFASMALLPMMRRMIRRQESRDRKS